MKRAMDFYKSEEFGEILRQRRGLAPEEKTVIRKVIINKAKAEEIEKLEREKNSILDKVGEMFAGNRPRFSEKEKKEITNRLLEISGKLSLLKPRKPITEEEENKARELREREREEREEEREDFEERFVP
ncbi:MAG: hypothetical protein V1911_03185 [Candidatus Micrarchaeota archaeon]